MHFFYDLIQNMMLNNFIQTNYYVYNDKKTLPATKTRYFSIIVSCNKK